MPTPITIETRYGPETCDGDGGLCQRYGDHAKPCVLCGLPIACWDGFCLDCQYDD